MIVIVKAYWLSGGFTTWEVKRCNLVLTFRRRLNKYVKKWTHSFEPDSNWIDFDFRILVNGIHSTFFSIDSHVSRVPLNINQPMIDAVCKRIVVRVKWDQDDQNISITNLNFPIRFSLTATWAIQKRLLNHSWRVCETLMLIWVPVSVKMSALFSGTLLLYMFLNNGGFELIDTWASF